MKLLVYIFGCLGGHLTDIFLVIMCISSCLDVNSLKRIGVDCIVPVHCIIWDTLQRIGIA